jgi:hypothetical protein
MSPYAKDGPNAAMLIPCIVHLGQGADKQRRFVYLTAARRRD